MSRSFTPILVVVAVSLALVGCGKLTERTNTISLVDAFPLADIQMETAAIDFGAPGSENFLVQGWAPGGSMDGHSFAWATGSSSDLRLTIQQPRALELSIVGWPLVFPEAEPQNVVVKLNGKAFGRFHLQPQRKPQEHRFRLPARLQKKGENRLTLHYSHSRRLADVLPGSKDARNLAVAWSSLRLVGVQAPNEPRILSGPENSALVLPVRTTVDYFFRLPSGGSLSIERLRSVGGSQLPDQQSVLEVTMIAAERPDEEIVEMLRTPAQGVTLTLPASKEPIRISLRSRSSASSLRERGGVVVQNPVVVTNHSPEDSEAADWKKAAPISIGSPPNVLIYLVDTLRADHLGCYGYHKPTSPSIDTFSSQATLFTSAMAQSSWTRPTVASLFTGLYAEAHGTNTRTDALPESLPTMAEVFSDAGYATAAFVVNGNVAPEFGFARGFQTYRLLRSPGLEKGENARSDLVNSAAFEWLERRPRDQPFLLYLHTADPHGPYVPPSPYRQRFASKVDNPETGKLHMLQRIKRERVRDQALAADLVALYDAEIAHNDHQFGRLLDKLEELKATESTLVIFLSDHGEEFLDHGGWGHGNSLYQEQIHVPLIIKFPYNFAVGENVKFTVRQIDILPTLLEFIGLQVPPGVQGTSFLKQIDSPSAVDGPDTFAYLQLDGREIENVISAGKELIHYRAEPSSVGHRFELYDIKTVGKVTDELAQRNPIWLGYLRSLQRLHRHRSRPRAKRSLQLEMSEELRQNLRALGYLN